MKPKNENDLLFDEVIDYGNDLGELDVYDIEIEYDYDVRYYKYDNEYKDNICDFEI